MENLNEACWEGYTQKGMKEVKGRMVPNCVPVEENIFSLVRAAKTPLKKKSTSTTELPSASGVVKGGKPEQKLKVHTVKDPTDTAHGIDPKSLAAGIEALKKKKIKEADTETTPDFKNMSDDERREYAGHRAERNAPHVPLHLLAKHGRGATGQLAKYAMRTPLEENETNDYCPRCMMEVLTGKHPDQLGEAQYQGRTVQLGKPMRGDVKKFKVFVKDPKTGNVKKVNFGDKTMKIKKSNPARRKSFRARHHCDTNPGPRTKARYWSCRKW